MLPGPPPLISYVSRFLQNARRLGCLRGDGLGLIFRVLGISPLLLHTALGLPDFYREPNFSRRATFRCATFRCLRVPTEALYTSRDVCRTSYNRSRLSWLEYYYHSEEPRAELLSLLAGGFASQLVCIMARIQCDAGRRDARRNVPRRKVRRRNVARRDGAVQPCFLFPPLRNIQIFDEAKCPWRFYAGKI